MGSKEPGIGLTDEEVQAKNDALKSRLDKLLSDNPDILMIAVKDEVLGIAMTGRNDWCIPCFTKYVVFTAMNNYAAHNLAAHADEFKEDVAKAAFNELEVDDGNTRAN